VFNLVPPCVKGGYTEVLRRSERPNLPLTPLTPLGKGGTRGSLFSPQECRGGVFFGESVPMPKLPTGGRVMAWVDKFTDLRSGNLARLSPCCVGEDGCCLEALF